MSEGLFLVLRVFFSCSSSSFDFLLRPGLSCLPALAPFRLFVHRYFCFLLLGGLIEPFLFFSSAGFGRA